MIFMLTYWTTAKHIDIQKTHFKGKMNTTLENKKQITDLSKSPTEFQKVKVLNVLLNIDKKTDKSV